MSKRQTRAFTLMEAMAALAIAGVIVVGATGAVMNINRTIGDVGKRTAAWDEAKRLEEFLIAQTQGVGGGQVRPHFSIFVENASGQLYPSTLASPGNCRSITGIPDCSPTNASDRLTVFLPNPDFPDCPVTGRVGASVNITVGPLNTGCCLNDSTFGPGGHENRQGLLVGANGVAVSVFLFNQNSAGPDGCAINMPPGQGNEFIQTDLDDVSYPATLVVANTQTFYVDTSGPQSTPHTLNAWTDLDGDNQASAGEITIIHDRVYDMQLAPGYDGRPEDGKLADTNNNADEFLFNNVGDGAMPNAVLVTQLRMMQIALAVGTPSEMSGGNQVQLLNRPTPLSVPKTYLASTSSKAFLRNLALFTQ